MDATCEGSDGVRGPAGCQARPTAWALAGLAGVICWLSAAVAPALAASAWLAPIDVTAAGAVASRPQIVVDSAGTAVAVWRSGVDGGEITVRSAVRPAGGSWQAPVDVSKPGFDGSSGAGSTVPGPQLAIDARGNALAVWQRFDGTSLVVQAAERPAGGAWGTPADVSVPSLAGHHAGDPRVAIDPRGNALAVWHRYDPGTRMSRLFSSDRPAGGAWQPPVAVSGDGASAAAARLALAADGTALVAWASAGSPPRSSVRPPGGSWQPTESIGDDTLSLSLDLALDPAGNAVAVWLGGSSSSNGVRAAVRPAGGGWQARSDLGPGHDPSVAVDAQGSAAAVWLNDGFARAASRPAGGEWQPAVELGPSAPSSAFTVIPETEAVADAHGAIAVAWVSSSAAGSDVNVSRRAGANWQAPVHVSAPGRSAVQPRLALDPLGNAVALWADRVAGVISAAGFDGSAPELRSLVVPPSAAIGRRVSFSASPFDVWSPLGSTLWAFGDGAAGTGVAVSHTYARLGPHDVDVSVTDALGNPVTHRRAIVIRPSVLGLRVTPSSYRAARRGSVSFRLPAASRVRFVVQRVRAGRRAGSRCVALTASNRRRAAGNRYIRVGTFTNSRPAGRHRVRLPARVAGRVLRAARYRLKATPTAAGLTGAPSRTGFRVRR